jgi:hypothetical protein
VVLAVATFGCGHAARSCSTSGRDAHIASVAAAIATRVGTVHHGLGRAAAHGSEVVFSNRKLSLSVSEPDTESKGAHVHVLARVVGVPAGTMDACIMGVGATMDESLANAAERYVDLAFPPLAALLEPAAQVDATPFSGDEPYGVPGYRGFVGDISATRSADGVALADATLFAGLGPVPADGRVHIAKAVLEAENGTWWRTLELDGQPTSIAHEKWSGAVAPGAPAMAIRFAVFGKPDTLTHDKGRAEASRILDGHPAWLRDDGCPTDIMPAALVQHPWSLRACAGGRLLDCVSECEGGRAASCYSAALETQQSKPTPPATLLFLRACRLGNSSACTNAAAGRQRMDECSVRTFERTCAQTGDAWGCAMLGLALAKGEGIARDLARARTVLRKACAKAKDDPACEAASSILGQIETGK